MGEIKLENKTYTQSEYLDLLKASDVKLEYRSGNVKAMAGGSIDHGRIGNNVQNLLTNALLEKECSVFSSDVGIYINTASGYYCPDASVVCGEEESLKNRFLKNPSIIVEVLSKSTEGIDKGVKFIDYSTLPSLKEYIIVHTDSPVVIVHSKVEKNKFSSTGTMGLESKIYLPHFDLEFKMKDIYRRVVKFSQIV